MDKHDNAFTHLYLLTKLLIDKITEIGEATTKQQISLFVELLIDITRAITTALNNYKNWASGKDQIDGLLEKRVQLQLLWSKLFTKFHDRTEFQAITNYNRYRERAIIELRELINLFL